MESRFEIFYKFQRFHFANPMIFKAYSDLALQLYDAGRRHYSSDALIHVLRFRNDIQTDAEDYKISNDFTAYYARMLAAVDKWRFEKFFTFKNADDSDLNFLSELDFRRVFEGLEVQKDSQLSLF